MNFKLLFIFSVIFVNFVFCSQISSLLSESIAETVFELKHRVKQLESNFDKTNKSLSQTTASLVETTKNLSQTTINLAEANKTLAQLTSNLAKTNISLSQTTADLVETNKNLAQLKTEMVPIGFTYVQLPKDKTPSELWPSMSWKDVSSDYEGVFFRVAGGEAADFGVVQTASAPNLEIVHSLVSWDNNVETSKSETIPKTGWSSRIFTGGYRGNNVYLQFKNSDVSEVRPKNMAIKVYRRVA